jgi:hypothetical protein
MRLPASSRGVACEITNAMGALIVAGHELVFYPGQTPTRWKLSVVSSGLREPDCWNRYALRWGHGL